MNLKEKDKLYMVKNLTKSWKDKKLQINDQDIAMANYVKQFEKTKSKPSIT